MKLKYYIRGLGIGIVLTTIILTISNNIRNAEKPLVSNTESQSSGSVIAYTQKDTASVEGTESTYTQSQPDSKQESESSKQDETLAEETKSTATQPATTHQEPKEDEKANNAVRVNIKNVYTAVQAADILYNRGVISDKDEFISYMKKSGYATKIKEGNYDIVPSASYESIAKIITQME